MSASQSGTNATPANPPAENLTTLPTRRRAPVMTGVGVAIVIVVAVIAIVAGYAVGRYTAPSSSSSTSVITISETGSSLLFPMMLNWSADYLALYPNVHVSVASTGSGTGQAESICGLVNMGASDTFIVNASSAKCSTGSGAGTYTMAQIPTAISAQLIYVNFPASSGITSGVLNINGTMLGEIYNGNITTWSNPLITAAQTSAVRTYLNSLNGTASNTIIPVARSDSSGDTGLFTGYITMSWTGWVANGHAQGTASLSGTLNTKLVKADLNSGVLSTIESTPFSIGYVGISYEHVASGVEYAAVGDNASISASGGLVAANYIQPTSTNIASDANLGLQGLNYAQYGLAVNLILGGSPSSPVVYPSGTGGRAPTATYTNPYPIVNLEYTMVRTVGTPTTGNPSGYATAQAIVNFYAWILSYGNNASIVGSVGFLPLTPAVTGYSMQTLETIAVS